MMRLISNPGGGCFVSWCEVWTGWITNLNELRINAVRITALVIFASPGEHCYFERRVMVLFSCWADFFGVGARLIGVSGFIKSFLNSVEFRELGQLLHDCFSCDWSKQVIKISRLRNFRRFCDSTAPSRASNLIGMGEARPPKAWRCLSEFAGVRGRNVGDNRDLLLCTTVIIILVNRETRGYDSTAKISFSSVSAKDGILKSAVSWFTTVVLFSTFTLYPTDFPKIKMLIANQAYQLIMLQGWKIVWAACFDWVSLPVACLILIKTLCLVNGESVLE